MATDRITLAHGAGGKLSQELMEEVILPEFGNPLLNVLHDGATIRMGGRLAFSTDSYVVSPLFFPGGNIGKLAVCGTVNDLAMTGAVPRYLSAGLILEEGLPIEDLKTIVRTMGQVAREAGVSIVTGDTKVVERGKADGMFINTAGIGEILPNVRISPQGVRPGMKVILSGFLGDHAATIMAGRHELEVPPSLRTDCAPLNRMVQAMLEAAPGIAVLRDPTRGGLAAVLNEIAGASRVGILIDEELLPIRPEVQGICDLLGLDPLQLANEGKVVAFVPPEDETEVLKAMRKDPCGREARTIGEAVSEAPGQVGLRTSIGGIRVVEMPLGNVVPRIC